jgi:hypothetical protein
MRFGYPLHAMGLISARIACHASPQPSPKERELGTEVNALLVKVLSFGEDLGEAMDGL